jgi:hypothetical protein
MAFTVEDGTGVAGANAYITISYADTYHAERGNAEWTGDDTAKEQAIVRATDYIETRWADKFLGRVEFTDPLQALSFPRLYLYDRNGLLVTGIPELLKRATAEYALRALTSELLPDPTVPGSSGFVTGVRERVGPIETETTYADVSQQTPLLRAYPLADRMIAMLVGRPGRYVYR